MTKRIIGWLLLLPFCVALVFFALANRHSVIIGFDPLLTQPPLAPTFEVPLFIVIFFSLILGVVLGGVATWVSQGTQRKQKREWRHKAKQMQAEKDAAKSLELEDANQNHNLLENS